MAWKIEFTPAADKDLSKLDPQTRTQIQKYLDRRVAGLNNPRDLGKPLSGKKSGLWRYRMDKYRIICDIRDSVMIVLVIQIGKRDRIYED
jgi:mRNA interferase RelE/StbE